MKAILSKTDYLLYRECPKNVWYKIHKPEVYYESELSEFEKSIIETGNEVELEARKLFPNGILIEGRDAVSQKTVMVQWETESPFRNNIDSLVNLSDSKVESITFSIA